MPLVSQPGYHTAGSPARPAIVAAMHVIEVNTNYEEINFKGKH
jgi:hypothetical protein